MNYPQRNRGRNTFVKPALFLGAIFFAGFILFSFTEGAIITLVSPLWKGENVATAKLSFVGDFFKFKSSLVEENINLKDRIRSLELDLVSRSSIIEASDSFPSVLGRSLESNGITSTALVMPPQTPYDMVIVDAGSNDGVALGYIARMPEGPILGMVDEVYESSSKVKLYTTPGTKTAAILERHGIPITIEGAGGGNFRIMVSRETEVEVGDRILSADISSQLLAVVGEVSMEATDSFKDVYAVSPINVFGLHYILIQP